MLPMFRGVRKGSATFKPATYIGKYNKGRTASSASAQIGDMVITVWRDEGDSPSGTWNKISLDDIAGQPGCTVFWRILDDVSKTQAGGDRYFVFRGPKTLSLVLTQAIYASTSVPFGPFATSRNHAGLVTVIWAPLATFDSAGPELTSTVGLTSLGFESYDYGYTNRARQFARMSVHISPKYNGQQFVLTKSTSTAEGVAGAVLEMVA
jgi:hypothetical protein